MSIPVIASYHLSELQLSKPPKVSWSLDPHRAALLIHDMQDYFLDKFIANAQPLNLLIAHCQKLLKMARALGLPIYYTAQLPEQSPKDRALLNDFWGPGLTAEPDRASIVSELKPQKDEVVLDKWRYSAFQRSDLKANLEQQNRDQLIICGVYAHIGCLATALEAFMLNFQPFMVIDACADFSFEAHQGAIDYVSQICGITLNTDEVCEQLHLALADQRQIDKFSETQNDEMLLLHELLTPFLGTQLKTLAAQKDLTLFGLDSIRMMILAEQLEEKGYCIDVIDLMNKPTLAAWQQLLQKTVRTL